MTRRRAISSSHFSRAAISPRNSMVSMASGWKLTALYPLSIGLMYRSAASLLALYLGCAMMPKSWSSTMVADLSASFSLHPVLKSTQMITSAPISFTTSTGRLFSAPPSTSNIPFHSTGAKAPGMDMLARMASGSEPESSTTSFPSTTSTVTHLNGMGSSEKLSMS